MRLVGIGLRFLLLFSGVALLVAVAYCQSTGTMRTGNSSLVISESVLMSWGVVLALLAVTATAITNFVEGRVHRANKDIHLSSGDLANKFELKEDCHQRHEDMKADFKAVNQRLDGIGEAVQFIKGKLEDKK
jgi:hypothetical protein